MFAIFLTLSVIFWFLSKLSKEYTSTVKFKAKYTNIENDFILQSQPLEHLDLTLKSHGFKLLSYKVNNPKLKIDLKNLQQLKNGNFYYLTNNNYADIQAQIDAESTILAIKPDTLFFDFGVLKSKKVLVNSHLNIALKKGYFYSSPITFEPEEIIITGPSKIIDSINNVNTLKENLTNVYQNFNKKIKLEKIDNVNFNIKEVTVLANIEKFTEGNLELKYDIINKDPNFEVTTFVKKINITYKVSLKNFDKIKADDFTIICDYAKAQKEGLKYLRPEFKRKSPLILDLKINPSKIEYLLKK